MRWVRGADMLHAASFSKPGGRLSIPVDLVRLMDFRSRSTSSFDCKIRYGKGLGLLSS